MAPPDPSTRHVGRVVDPAVREAGDSELEPIVELEPSVDLEPGAEPEPGIHPDPSVEPEPEALADDAARGKAPEMPAAHELAEPDQGLGPLRGERLRQRLLARAESARRAQESRREGPREAAAAPQPEAAREDEVVIEPTRQPPEPPDAPSYGDLDEIGRAPTDEPSVPLARAPKPTFLPSTAGLSPAWIAVFGTLLGVGSVVSLLALVINLDPRTNSAPLSRASATPAPPASAAVAPEAPQQKRQRTRQPGPWRIADVKDAPATRVIEGKIGKLSFLKALEAAGVPLKESYRVLAAMKGIRNFDRCGSSDRFIALLDRSSSRLRAFEYQIGPEEVYQAREDAGGLLRGSKLDLKVERAQVVGALTIKGKSFEQAAELAGFENGLSRVVSKALEGHLALDELEHGDRVRVVAQELTVLGEFGRYTGVEAIEVRRADESRAPLRVYYLDLGSERGYYDGEGHSPHEGGWRKPIKDAPMSSPFNLKRMHPVLKKTMPHLGMDLAAPTGTPVGAASFGTVTFLGNGGPSGNLVKVMHANEIETGYAHLSRFAEGLKVGDKVKRLQLVGYVGSTGRSTGPHLHFSASKKGAYFDPATLNLDGMRTLPKANREAFLELKKRYDALLDRIPLPPAVAPQVPEAGASDGAIAAPEPGVGGDMVEGDAFDQEEALAAVAAAPKPPAAKVPAVNAPAANAPAVLRPGQPDARSSVHLTDAELLELQGASDDGEVED